MNGFVTIELFGHKSLRCAAHRQFVISNLVLDDGVNNRMQFLAWETDPRTSMILHHKLDPFLFAQREPLLRVWLHEWIVASDRSFRLLERRSGEFPRLRIIRV